MAAAVEREDAVAVAQRGGDAVHQPHVGAAGEAVEENDRRAGLSHRPVVELDAVVRGEPTVLGRAVCRDRRDRGSRQDLGVLRAHGGEVPAVGQHVAPERLELALHARDLLVGLVERAVDREHRHFHAREVDAVALAGLPGVLAQRAQRCFVVVGVLARGAKRAAPRPAPSRRGRAEASRSTRDRPRGRPSPP